MFPSQRNFQLKPLPQAIILALLLCATPVAAEDNYCQDEDANREWAELLARTPNYPLLIKLYALRAGLCVMVEHNLISLQQATAIFEAERDDALRERQSAEKAPPPVEL